VCTHFSSVIQFHEGCNALEPTREREREREGGRGEYFIFKPIFSGAHSRVRERAARFAHVRPGKTAKTVFSRRLSLPPLRPRAPLKEERPLAPVLMRRPLLWNARSCVATRERTRAGAHLLVYASTDDESGAKAGNFSSTGTVSPWIAVNDK